MSLKSASDDRNRRAILSLVQGPEGKLWSESLQPGDGDGGSGDGGNGDGELPFAGWSASSAVPVCEWTGVSCVSSTNDGASTVAAVRLPSRGLSATIPPDLRALSGLETLDLQGNLLYGTIPPELAALPKLQRLDLSGNELTGTVPPRFVSRRLALLSLNENGFSGPFFPDADAPHLQGLVEVNLANNMLSGTLHGQSLSRMSNLELLSLSENDLSGMLPGAQLGGLSKLEYLYLDSNHFVGPLPAKLAQVGKANLSELWLHMNDLSGTVPASFERFDRLVNFYIDGNKLTGVLPPEICGPGLNSDFFVDVPPEAERNYCDSIACPAGTVALEGVYPCRPCAGGKSAVRKNPYLGHEGDCEIPTQRGILEKFYKSTSAGGQWKGGSDWNDKSKFMCDLTGIMCDAHNNVISIALGARGLKGEIPNDVGFLPFLEKLDLSDNELTGYLPSDLRWTSLADLDISGNQIRGVVPPLVCFMTELNDNGENDDYNCHKVACPVGTYNSLGRLDDQGEGDPCLPCLDDSPFIGRKTCANPDAKSRESHPPMKHILDAVRESGAGLSVSGKVGLGVALGALVVAVVFCICLRRVRKSSRPKYRAPLDKSSSFYTDAYSSGDHVGPSERSNKNSLRKSVEDLTGLDKSEDEDDSDYERKANLRRFSAQQERSASGDNPGGKGSRYSQIKKVISDRANKGSRRTRNLSPDNFSDESDDAQGGTVASRNYHKPKKSGKKSGKKSNKRYSSMSPSEDFIDGSSLVDAEWGIDQVSSPRSGQDSGGRKKKDSRKDRRYRDGTVPKKSDLLDVPSIE